MLTNKRSPTQIQQKSMYFLKKILLFSLFPLCFLSIILLFLQLSNHSHHHFSKNHPTFSPPPPKLAYFISGTNNDGPRLFRLLLAIYHPRNYYLLHLDQLAPQKQRDQLAKMVASVPVFAANGNVLLVEKSNRVNQEGSSYLALLLHGAAILLRWKRDWNWFINLDSSDYPLIPQDDLLHIMSFLPKDLNFIKHETNTTSEEIEDIIVDPRLYLRSAGKMFKGNKKRSMPSSFRFRTGSPHVILTRKLVEFAIIGWENFPRKLLLYLSNTRHSHNVYFQTIAYNSKRFLSTVINSNLRSTDCDAFCMKIPHSLRRVDFKKMLTSGAVFAGEIPANDPVLDMIDSVVLNRGRGMIAPGGWCLSKAWFRYDSCWQWGDADVLRPGAAAERFEKLLVSLLGEISFTSKLAKVVN